MQTFDQPPPTSIHADSQLVFESIKTAPLSILCGRNNSGKSFILRQVLRHLGNETAYLGPARYSNFNVFSPYGFQPNRRQDKYNNMLRHFLQSNSQNVDNSPVDLQRAIAELSDEQRRTLFTLIAQLLGASTTIKHTIPNNSMSQQYVDVDGFNLSFTSSGFRLVITLLTSLMDTDYNRVLIDEPELGLSPEIQGVFADWLLDTQHRQQHLEHLTTIVLATHSPIFLDRRNIANNIVVDRVDNEITLERVSSVQQLNQLQFRLLGNRFETIFLPSAIVLVEGKTDHAYLSRLINLKFPTSYVSIISANSDSRIREVVAIARQMFGDIRRSPYANRIFVVLDARHGSGLKDQLSSMGIDNVIVWEHNGIEFLYPESVIEQRFGQFSGIEIDGDRVTINAHNVSKQELSEFVINTMTSDDVFPAELDSKLIKPLQNVLY